MNLRERAIHKMEEENKIHVLLVKTDEYSNAQQENKYYFKKIHNE